MPHHKVTSAKYAIGRLIREFKIKDQSIIDDLHEYAIETLEFCEHHAGFRRMKCRIKIASHRGLLPHDYHEEDFVEHSGKLMLPSNDVTLATRELGRTTIQQPNPGSVSYGLATVGTNPTDLDNPPIYNTRATSYGIEKYYLEGNYIKTEFESGYVYLYYRAHMIDECGLPMIPDTIYYKEAIFWYAAYRLVLGGYQPPNPRLTLEYCEDKKNHYISAAANDAQFPSIPDMERFKRSWVRLVPNYNAYSDYFMELDNLHQNRV